MQENQKRQRPCLRVHVHTDKSVGEKHSLYTEKALNGNEAGYEIRAREALQKSRQAPRVYILRPPSSKSPEFVPEGLLVAAFVL